MKNGFIKLANVTPKLKTADVNYNMAEIKSVIDKIDADIVTFPEMAVTGYSCGDLFFFDDIINEAENAIKDFLETNTFEGLIILGAPVKVDNFLYNTAIVIQKDLILGIVPKSFLPNNDTFYEKRWFTAEYDFDSVIYADMEVPFGNIIFNDELNKIKMGVEICYDMFAPISMSSIYAVNGCNLIFNIAASTDFLGKDVMRRNFINMKSKECSCIYSYTSCGVNESTSSFVFAGEKMVSENGIELNRGELFNFDTNILYTIADVDKINHIRTTNTSLRDSIGTIDYEFDNVYFTLPDKEYIPALDDTPYVPKKDTFEAFKTISSIQEVSLARRVIASNSKTVVIGISGGLDSTLAVLVAVNAFKRIGRDLKDIIAITMPGLGTSTRTKSNAYSLMEKLGVTVKEIPISDSVSAHFKDIEHDPDNTNVTYENAQARMRTMILMDIANDNNGIVLGTGDMSEIALGWATYNGDQMSMYNVNGNIPKTLVRFMVAQYALYEFPILKDTLKDIIDTPISPELKKDQKTEDSVGKYEINDFILYHFLNNGYSVEKIQMLLGKVFNIDPAPYIKNFFNRFYTQQFKRQALADGVQVLPYTLESKTGFYMPADIARRIK